MSSASADALDRTTISHPSSKEWNDFFSPMFYELNADAKINSTTGEFEMQLQIGSSLHP
jgi:hypothetical protein